MVNRILTSSVSELWRFQEQAGIDVEDSTGLVTDERPPRLVRSTWLTYSGSTRCVHVAEYLHGATAIASTCTADAQARGRGTSGSRLAGFL